MNKRCRDVDASQFTVPQQQQRPATFANLRTRRLSALFAPVWFHVLVVAAFCSTAAAEGTHPNLYLNQAEIELIKQQVTSGEAPWAGAHADLLNRASNAMSASPNPVAGVYPSDKTEPRSHYKAVTRDSDLAMVLGLAYAFTGDRSYAAKARQFIMAWVNNLEPVSSHYQQGIELSITLPSFFYAADVIWHSGDFEDSDRAAFQKWARDFGYAMIETEENSCCGPTHNIHNWEWAMQLAAGVVAEEQYLIDRAIGKFKDVTGSRYESDGRFKSEGTRTLEYAFFALTALTTVAEAARHQGVDLYSHEVGGHSLAKAAKAHFSWYYNRNYPGSDPNYDYVTQVGYTGLAEIYNSLYGDAVYLQAISKYGGRPTYDRWDMGPLTLTHGERTLHFAVRPNPPEDVQAQTE